MIAFIDDHREAHGVEPICKVLPIAPSTYHAHVARRADPAKRSARAKRDAALKPEVRRVFDDNFQVYGVRKVWRQLRRENHDVARCTVERLMRDMGLQGAIRGKPVRTTVSDKTAPCPLDHVNRQFRAPRPNVLWVSDFTYVATWAGFVYVAFVIDAYARRIVGWRASRTAHAGFVLDALEQALHDRRPIHRGGLVHHSDRGSQYVSIKYTERLAEAGIEPSVGSVGDSYDNALAETINGLYKAEVIHRRGPWRSFEAVEFATLEWVDWFNNRRLLEPIGNIPPAEAEERYYAMLEAPAMAAYFKPNSLRQTRGGSKSNPRTRLSHGTYPERAFAASPAWRYGHRVYLTLRKPHFRLRWSLMTSGPLSLIRSRPLTLVAIDCLVLKFGAVSPGGLSILGRPCRPLPCPHNSRNRIPASSAQRRIE